MARALINVPAKTKRGDVIEIKTLISHSWKPASGPRRLGPAIPRDIITTFVCSYNGNEVFRADLHPAIAGQSLCLVLQVATETGTLKFEWTGDNGYFVTETARASITVE